MKRRSVLAVVCGAVAYLAWYGLFVAAITAMGAALGSPRLLGAITVLWMVSTALSGVVSTAVLGTRSFFHGCAAGALGALLMLVVLHWLLFPNDRNGFLAVFWVIASAALGGVGSLIGPDRTGVPPRSMEP